MKWAVALAPLLLWPLAGFGQEPKSAPPLDLPQARINHVDVSQWPKVRVLATLLDAAGRPIQLKAVKKLVVADGQSKQKPPYIAFQLGQSLEGRKDGKLQTADKAGVANAIVFLAAGYQDPSLRSGSLGRRLVEALQTGLKPLGKTDRVNLVWYADRIQQWMGLKGKAGGLSDVEGLRQKCRDARAEARAGGDLTLGDVGGKDKKPPEPGTDLCGLTGDPKTIGTILKSGLAAFEGYFPRLFNLGRPFYTLQRYCKAPKEALKDFGEFSNENVKIQIADRDTRKAKGEELDYETSAFDEALHLLLRDARENERKALVIVSDGRDGHYREIALCKEAPPPSCNAFAGEKAKYQACQATYMKSKVAAQQLEFRSRAAHWIGVARAAGVRVYAVGLGMLGQPYELERLRVLAERTNGTYRQADKEENLASEVQTTMAEITGQIAIDFTHQAPDDALETEKPLSLRIVADLDPSMVRGDVVKLQSVAFDAVLPRPLPLKAKIEKAVRGAAVKAQDLLGYKTYVVVGIALLAVIGLVVLLFTFLILRAIVRKIRG
jgi:hypothetical protein